MLECGALHFKIPTRGKEEVCLCVCVCGGGGRYLVQNVLGSETVGGGLFMSGGGVRCFMQVL